MNMTLEQLKDSAERLPATERAELADHLLRTLPEDDAVREAWLDVSEQRLAEMHAGLVVPIDGEEVFRYLGLPQ